MEIFIDKSWKFVGHKVWEPHVQLRVRNITILDCVFTFMCLSSAASPGQVSDPQHFSSREPGVLPEDEGRLLPLPG